MFIAPVLVVAWTQSMIQGTVVDIKQTRTFAGRLGYRVVERVVVEANGQRFELPPTIRHTRSHSVRHEVKIGDTVSVRSRT